MNIEPFRILVNLQLWDLIGTGIKAPLFIVVDFLREGTSIIYVKPWMVTTINLVVSELLG